MVRPIPFGEWLPDQASISGGMGEAKGVMSRAKRYAPLAGLSPQTARLGAACIGGASFYQGSAGGVIQVFLGTGAGAYTVVDGVITSVGRSGGYGSSIDGDWAWRFEQFGPYVVGTARGVTAQYYKHLTDRQFRDMPGAPVADVCFRVRQHMLLGQGRRVIYSPDLENWIADASAEIGEFELDQRAGQIMAGVGGEIGALFQERGISRLQYVGQPTTWQRDEVELVRGAISPNAVAAWGRNVFFVSESGFYVFDGLQATPIGQDKVDHWFSSRLNYNARGRVSCAVDTDRKCFVVAFPTGSNTSPDHMLIYSFADNRWTHDDIAAQYVFSHAIEGVSLDNDAALNALLGAGYVANGFDDASMADISLDGPLFQDGRLQWAAVDPDRYLSFFNGVSRAATLDTGMAEAVPGRRAFVTEVWPLIDAPAASITAGVVSKPQLLSDAPDPELAMIACNEVGFAPVRVDGRFIAMRAAVAAGATWTEAVGVHTNARPSGMR